MTDNDNIRRIAEELLIIASQNDETDVRSPVFKININERNFDKEYLVNLARILYRARRVREKHFGKDLFGEPAWDMLLDLYVYKFNGVRNSVTSLCLASQVPESTALRWIGLLNEEELIVREKDDHDRRRAFISLSPKGEIAVRRYLIDVATLLQGFRLPNLMLV